MPRNDDAAYRQAQSRQVRDAADRFAEVNSGPEAGNARREYDRQLRREMPVDGKGRRTR